jgi:N6-adenosine-specific RNA methylase IME4
MGQVVKYRTIVADPPWRYSNRSGGGFDVLPRQLIGDGSRRKRSTRDLGYPTMPLEDIAAMHPPAADDAHLYLWTTNAFMCEAHDVARAWGFRPKTILTWVKIKPDGTPSAATGYYFRGATEHVIFATRGTQPLLVKHVVPTAFLWPRLAHSIKPNAFYDLVEQVSPGPYLELFARRNRLGWDSWGNEALCHVEMVAEAVTL